MLPSLKIGRFFDIPVYLHSTLVLLPVLVLFNSWGQPWPTMLLMLAATLTLFLCVLLHEFGHALMARWFGIVTRDVTLYPIGGVARLERMAEKPIEEILIALAGPAVNVVIAALLTPVVFAFIFLGGEQIFANPFVVTFADAPDVWLAKFSLFLWASNIVLVVFNLLPAFPMDGGRVLRAVLAHFFGLLRGTEIAVPIGIGVVVVFAFVMVGGPIAVSLLAHNDVGSINPMPLVIAAFISLVGPMELRALRYRERQKQHAQQAGAYAGSDEPQPYTPLPYPDEDNGDPRPEAPLPAPLDPQLGFSGLTWDREFGVWVKWHNGRRVAAYWNGAE